jgi:hypothetical protein
MAPVAKPLKKIAAAPAKKPAGNRQEFLVKFESPGVVLVEGVIVSLTGNAHDGGVIMLSHKRRGSSRQIVAPIPFKRVKFARGVLRKGQRVQIGYTSDNHVFSMLRRCELTGDIDSETGLMKGMDEKGQPFLIHEDNINAVTTTAVDTPPIKVSAKGG